VYTGVKLFKWGSVGVQWGPVGGLIACSAHMFLNLLYFCVQCNKLTDACSSYSGVMADQDLVVLNSTQGYARRTSTDGNAEGQKVAHFTWDDIEEQTGLVINTLVIDCEGCLLSLIEMFKHKSKQIKKIILEND
jgi:hypothetical protein